MSISTATCSLKTEKRVITRGDCETVDEINVTYCSGSCGNSSSIPVFMMDDGMEYDNFGCIQTCKCCQGTVRGMQTVDIRCGLPGQKRLYKARVPVIVACKCDACVTTGKIFFSFLIDSLTNFIKLILFKTPINVKRKLR